MNQAPTLCMIFEAIGPYSAIGKVAMSGVRTALDAGWRVTVVAKLLDESLRDEVEWLRLYVPPRLFFVQWVTARHFIRQSLGDRAFDVVHAHQPQVADLADVFQCHYLTRMAYERKCLERRPGLRAAAVRAQEQGVLYAEDYFYRRWNPKTRMLFDSELTRKDFQRLYGLPPREQVLLYSSPPLDIPSEQERREARRKILGLEYKGIVVGYLGGLHERKGYRRLIQGLQGDNDTFLLMGGQYCDGFTVPSMPGRFKAVGLVSDTAAFYAACDIFAVPSYYEPFGLVALEAAARGLPVVATAEVGALPHLLEYGAGVAWDPTQPLGPLVHSITFDRVDLRGGAQRMAEDLSDDRQGQRLLEVYDQVLREKGGATPQKDVAV